MSEVRSPPLPLRFPVPPLPNSTALQSPPRLAAYPSARAPRPLPIPWTSSRRRRRAARQVSSTHAPTLSSPLSVGAQFLDQPQSVGAARLPFALAPVVPSQRASRTAYRRDCLAVRVGVWDHSRRLSAQDAAVLADASALSKCFAPLIAG